MRLVGNLRSAVVAFLILPGCLRPSSDRAHSVIDPPGASTAELLGAPPPPPETATPAFPPGVTYVALDVRRVELTLDEVRDARKVWNHVDEMRAGPQGAVRLGRNGVRIGAAGPDAWPAIGAVLEASHARISSEQVFTLTSAPVSLKLAGSMDGESIFVYGANDHLSGKSYPAGEKLINLEFDPAGSDGSIELRPTFEVRQDLGVMTWDASDGAIREVPEYNRHVFEAVGGTIPLSPGESLVIGLGEGADRPYLLGPRFLAFERGPQRFELLLFLTPRLMGSPPPM